MLSDLLTEARDLGLLGGGPVSRHVEQSQAFAAAIEAHLSARRAYDDVPVGRPRSVVDLGSGAGVPGLVLAMQWQSTPFVLVESNLGRARFLLRAVKALDLTARVSVTSERAENIGRTLSRRGTVDVVTARGFGRPAVVAECAAPLLEVGGVLIVSEPPPGVSVPGVRWPARGLAELGMGQAEALGSEFHFMVVTQERPCPDRYPRRVGVPSKRPLF